ncbi:endonuclease/exonuclease/phosphatase family protein [Flagellimonas sp. HMM57]|uniref:endonuclease/exonuclease/phosphatase family protein n=1 Tax=unclassified Flagellimonas TaxID=2644544 RepID=UPI0013D04337|nr:MULTISPECIES: endonuclease/exonuclease/phosphatase family protein [unclassified Flagellimonas]UII77847.1 endonuclease/exonuclease/phosphatase family protein [Flagellimonas sp. HMM57]
MKIMCLNGWGGKLYDKLLPYLIEENPDVLCLQEVVHTLETDKDWLMYKDGDHILPQRANFFQDVQTALPDHIGIFCPASQGILWDEEIKIPSQWGLATFVRKSYPIIGQIQRFVHKSYAPYDYGEHPRSRSAHAIKVFDYKEDRSVVVAHMHGLRDLNGKMDTPERTVQAHKLMSLANELTEQNDSLVVCGDFNVEPNSETLKILSKAGLTELVTTRTSKGTRNSQYKKESRYADYMLVNELINVLGFNVIFEPEVSDHCPLVLTI